MRAGDGEIALELVGVALSIARVPVLRGVSIAVRRGEIMGLCAEEEYVKSAALRVAAGAFTAREFSGEVRVNGERVSFHGPRAARNYGLCLVHREALAESELTVAEHLMLGREPKRFGFVDGVRAESAARAVLAELGCASWIDARAPMSDLDCGKRKLIEIMRALASEPSILLLDEPCALLGPRESMLLARWLVAARMRKMAIIYASRRIDEIFELCDRVTVLRQGRTAARFDTRESDPETVVSTLLGRELRGIRRAATAM